MRFQVCARLAAAFFVLSLAGGTSAAESGPGLELHGPLPADAWLDVTALTSAERPWLWKSPPAGEPLDLPPMEGDRAMACLGGPELVTVCLEVSRLDTQVAVLTPRRQGIAVEGRCSLPRRSCGRTRVQIFPAGLRATRPFTWPLRLGTDGKLVRYLDSDDEGAFRIPALAPGEYRLELRPPGGRVVTSDAFVVPAPEDLNPEQEQTLNLGEILLEEGVTVTVQLLDLDGLPLAAGQVSAMQEASPLQEDSEHEWTHFEAAVDENGQARLTGLQPAQAVRVGCHAAGYQRWEQLFEVVPDFVECPLAPLASLAGQVLDDRGEPVPDVVISLSPQVVTGGDAAGAFEFTGLEAGAYFVTVAAPGWRAQQRQVTLAAGDDVRLETIHLQPGTWIEGVVLDAQGEPVPDVQLQALQPPGAVSTVSAADGTFDFEVADDERLQLQLTAAGFPRQNVLLTPENLQAEPPLRLTLEAGGKLAILAWNAAGEPCASCSVTYLSPGRTQPEPLTTNAAGSALSPWLPAGEYHLYLDDQQSLGSTVRVQGGAGVTLARVRSGETTRVELGERRRLVRLQLDAPLPVGWSLSAHGARGVEQAEGQGARWLVHQGAEDLRLRLSGPEAQSIWWTTLAANSAEEALHLSLPRGRVVGALTDADDLPRMRERVSLVRLNGEPVASVTTDGRGLFDLPFAPVGAMHLQVAGRTAGSVLISEFGVTDAGTLRVATPLEP